MDKIKREHILAAIKEIEANPLLRKGRASSTYDLIYEGKDYPPKLVISIANRYATGVELDHNAFLGGPNKPSFNLLEKEGFEIKKKNESINRYQLKENFLNEWPLSRIEKITIEEYTNLDKTSFCYWLEAKTEDLGSIWGGSAYKFGIYKRKDTSTITKVKNRITDGEYAWFQKYGATKEVAFQTVKNILLNIIENIQKGTLENIDAIDLGDAYKWKIAFLYGNYNVVNIYKHESILEAAQSLGFKDSNKNYSALNQFILSQKDPRQDYFEFTDLLWSKTSLANKTKYWLYAPGENANKWEEFYSEGIMGLGWDDIGDLKKYNSRDEIKDALVKAYKGDGSKKNDVSANDDFLNKLNIGDIVIAKKGRRELLGYGTVTSEYYFDENRIDYKSCKKIEWKLKGNWKVDFSLVLKTLTDITKYETEDPLYNKYYERLMDIMVNNNKLNYKEAYYKWLVTKIPKDSGTKSSYIRAIDLLSETLGYSIFEENSIEKMNLLYEDLIVQQRIEGGKYWNAKSTSYGLKGFYSAAIKTYTDFLKSINSKEEKVEINDSFDYTFFSDKINQSGLIFSPQLVQRFIASLCTKPFVICSGLSGSGKTKLAQAFVQCISENDIQYKIVPVGADWTNREPLVGYPNGLMSKEYITPDSGVIHLLIEAIKKGNENKPFFIILDEMNLSHVERYFADFLSIMESNDSIKLYTGDKRESLDGLKIPFEIGWPKNVFIIGTVNIDETTYMFSPKVLDRANVIEFRITEEEIATYLADPSCPKLENLKGKGAGMAKSFLDISGVTDLEKNDAIATELVSFFKQLKTVGAEFGYRSATEIMQLAAKLKMLESSISNNDCLDIAIMQKLLPKLHGSRSKLVKILIALSGLCVEGITKEEFEKKFEDLYKIDFEGLTVKYPISFEKLIRMYKNVLANGFTSYAEA
jgi:5-methylcytosine-specific restriction protein B